MFGSTGGARLSYADESMNIRVMPSSNDSGGSTPTTTAVTSCCPSTVTVGCVRRSGEPMRCHVASLMMIAGAIRSSSWSVNQRPWATWVRCMTP